MHNWHTDFPSEGEIDVSEGHFDTCMLIMYFHINMMSSHVIVSWILWIMVTHLHLSYPHYLSSLNSLFSYKIFLESRQKSNTKQWFVKHQHKQGISKWFVINTNKEKAYPCRSFDVIITSKDVSSTFIKGLAFISSWWLQLRIKQKQVNY